MELLVKKMTMSLIASVKVSLADGNNGGVTFSSIPQSGTDLLVMISGRSNDTTTSPMYLEIQGSTTGYSYRSLVGTGSAVSSNTGTSAYIGNLVPSSYNSGNFSNTSVYIPKYSGAQNKTWSSTSVQENNAQASNQLFIAGQWSINAQIYTLRIYPGGSTLFANNSTISLYMITKGSGGATVA